MQKYLITIYYDNDEPSYSIHHIEAIDIYQAYDKALDQSDHDIDILRITLLVVRYFLLYRRKQFEKNKTKLELVDEKYVHIGAGGYMPARFKDLYLQGLTDIHKEFNLLIAKHSLRYDLIKYELGNHEANYTHDVTSTYESLIGRLACVTIDEVLMTFNS